MIRAFNTLFLLLFTVAAFGQDNPQRITVKYIPDVLKIDGILDEEVWETAESADNFWQFFPTDSLRAKHPTEIKMLYNENTLYVGIRADAYGLGGDFVASSLRRDFSGTSNDNVSLMFDTFSDGTNAFLFGVTPYGVQREGLISEGGSAAGFNTSWDIKWLAESKMYEDYYTIEIAIPFSSLKFPGGTKRWRFQGYRWNLQTNEQSAWARVPQNQLLSSLAFMGEMVFEKPLGDSRTPVAIIPYVNTSLEKSFVVNELTNETGEYDTGLSVGGDAKIAIGNSMNLDLTLNPDFSNVEVDQIITNLTRFEISLPERRQFFIDNSDLFGSFGSSRDAIPFFSRRIGIARDTAGNQIQNRILGGARLSGKLNENWRLGFLNIQTDEDLANEIPSNNNTMLALQRRVFSRSNIGFFMINRQTFGNYEFQKREDKYNRVVGIDYNLASADNVWTGNFYLHKSFQPGDGEGNYSSQAFMIYNTRNWRFATDFVYVGEDFRSDLGFIPRKDIFKTGHFAGRNFYPRKGFINSHSFQLLALNFWRPTLDYKRTDHDLRASWSAILKNQSTFELEYSNKYIFLTNPFDPTRTEGAVPLPGNEAYYFNQVSTMYQSNRSKLISFELQSTVGEFFNGSSFSVGGTSSLRLQHWALIGLAVNYDQIRLPNPYPDADLWLLSPRIDLTFSKSLFWSTLVQYSNQRDNLGFNSRLQWRFAPLSDLYLVYNDNYFVNHFSPRFRSINLKLSYWLNL